MWICSSRTHSTLLLVFSAWTLVISAFVPAQSIRSERAIPKENPRPETNVSNTFTFDGPTDPQEFEAFLDPLVAELMNANHIPGGAIGVVKDGQIFFAKGYGFADIERGVPATADRTM